MTEEKKTIVDGKVACEVCFKEIPVSEAKSEEATTYVMHFCGLDCYDKWTEQKPDKKD